MDETVPKTVKDESVPLQPVQMTEEEKWNEVRSLMQNLGLPVPDKNSEIAVEQNRKSVKEAKKHLDKVRKNQTNDHEDDDETTTKGNPAKAKSKKVMKDWNSATRLEKLLHPLAAASVYCEEEKYDEAYGLLNAQMHLGEKVTFLPLLMDYYKSLVFVGRWKEAKEIKNEFIKTVQESLDVTPKECELLADSYRVKNENLKAILLYQAAEAMYTGLTETDVIINCMQGCGLGLKLAVTELVKQRPDLRSIVSRDVVPAIRRVYGKLTGMMGAHGEKMVLIRSLCLHHIETTELILENNAVREKTLQEAIAMMDEELKERACNFHLYSAHVNNLAVTCMSQDRPDEAIKLFEQSLKNRSTAQDYDDPAEKERDLEMTKKGLLKAHEMREYMPQQ